MMSLEGDGSAIFVLGIVLSIMGIKETIKGVIRQGVLALLFLCITEIVFSNFFQKRKIQPSISKFVVIRHEMFHSILTLMSGSIIGKTMKIAIMNGYINLFKMDDIRNSSSSRKWILIRIVLEVIFYFIIFDIYFYFGHRLLHTNKFLYQTIHKSHHISTSPNAITGFAFHPLEGIIFGMFLPLYCIATTILTGGIMKSSVIICGLLQVFQSLSIHSGYELVPASFFEHSFLSVFLTPTFHDRHHEHPNCNFSGFFTWLDDFFDTADHNWRIKYASWQRYGRQQQNQYQQQQQQKDRIEFEGVTPHGVTSG